MAEPSRYDRARGGGTLGAPKPSPVNEQSEIASRLQTGSLLVCENCGGQGFTDAGTTACDACYGIGVRLPCRTESLR